MPLLSLIFYFKRFKIMNIGSFTLSFYKKIISYWSHIEKNPCEQIPVNIPGSIHLSSELDNYSKLPVRYNKKPKGSPEGQWGLKMLSKVTKSKSLWPQILIIWRLMGIVRPSYR